MAANNCSLIGNQQFSTKNSLKIYNQTFCCKQLSYCQPNVFCKQQLSYWQLTVEINSLVKLALMRFLAVLTQFKHMLTFQSSAYWIKLLATHTFQMIFLFCLTLVCGSLHTSALIQSLFAQPPITLLDITAKLLIRQLCYFHIISI